MTNHKIKERLSGNEIVKISGFAIAYTATLKAPGGGHSFGVIGGPSMIQAKDIPKELHEPILALIDQYEGRRWGLKRKEKRP